MALAYHSRTLWTFLFCLFCYVFAGVSSLKCLQCSSNENPSCYHGTTPAKECPNKNHSLCVTFSGYVKETRRHLVFRNCTQNNLSKECMRYPVNATGDSLNFTEMRVCYFTCQTDGCNRDVHDQASHLRCFPQLIILISFLFVCATLFTY